MPAEDVEPEPLHHFAITVIRDAILNSDYTRMDDSGTDVIFNQLRTGTRL